MELTRNNIHSGVQSLSSSKGKLQDAGSVALEKGDVITARIVSVDGANVRLSVAGAIINARNEGTEPLYEGMRQNFEVVNANNGEIFIRQVSLGSEQKAFNEDIFLLKTLENLGVSATDKNLDVITAMFKQGNMISKGSFNAIKNDMLLLDKIVASVEKQLSADIEVNNAVNVSDTTPASKPAGVLLNGDNVSSLLNMGLKEVYSDKNALKLLTDLIVLKQGADVLLSENKGVLKAVKAESNLESVELLKTAQASSGEVKPDKNADIKTDLKGELTLPFKDILLLLKELSKNPSTLAFLSKTSSKPTLFNLLFTQSLLKEDFPFTELALKMAEKNPKAKTELINIAKALLSNISDAKDLNDVKIKEQFLLSDMLKSELINNSDAKSDASPDEKMLSNAYRSLNTISSEVQSFIVPLFNGETLTDVEIFIRDEGEKSKNSKSGDDKLIYLALTTKTMDRVKIKIDYKKNDLRISFIVKDEKVKNHLSENIDALTNKVSTIVDKNVSLSVTTSELEDNLSNVLSGDRVSSHRIDRLV